MSDTQRSKFLFTILKHVDTKSIDWNTIAQEHELKDGKAAYKRFWDMKQKLEKESGANGGSPVKTQPKPRSPRKKAVRAANKAAADVETEKQSGDGEKEGGAGEN